MEGLTVEFGVLSALGMRGTRLPYANHLHFSLIRINFPGKLK
jgi:hypothetical protein